MFGGSHKSDFHNLTKYGSKMCHRSVMCVMCDTTQHVSCHMYILMDSSHYSSKNKCTSLKHFHEQYGHFPIFSGSCGMPEPNYDPDLRLLRPSPHSQLIRKTHEV